VEFGTFGMRPSSRLVRRKDFERAKSKSMRYITEIVEYSPKADDMAKRIELKANEMAGQGYSLVTMSITGAAKAILVFEKVD